jgi:hypothetical protein
LEDGNGKNGQEFDKGANIYIYHLQTFGSDKSSHGQSRKSMQKFTLLQGINAHLFGWLFSCFKNKLKTHRNMHEHMRNKKE